MIVFISILAQKRLSRCEGDLRCFGNGMESGNEHLQSFDGGMGAYFGGMLTDLILQT